MNRVGPCGLALVLASRLEELRHEFVRAYRLVRYGCIFRSSLHRESENLLRETLNRLRLETLSQKDGLSTLRLCVHIQQINVALEMHV